MTTDSLDFDDSIGVICDRILACSSRPRLIAIYGDVSHGKTTLFRFIAEALGLPNVEKSGSLAENNMDEYVKFTAESDRMRAMDAIFYECYWLREDSWDDPNNCAKKYFGRPCDLNIGIYDPKRSETMVGRYDLYDVIVSNPRAKPHS